MSRLTMEVQYPCGLRVKATATSWFREVQMKTDDKACPLHADRCVPRGA